MPAAIQPAAYDAVAALEEVEALRGVGSVRGQQGPRDWVYGGPLPAGGVTLTYIDFAGRRRVKRRYARACWAYAAGLVSGLRLAALL